MSLWNKLASMLGVRTDQVDDALSDERRARVQMTRRGFLAAGAAVAAASMLPGGSKAYSFGGKIYDPYEYRLLSYPQLVCSRPDYLFVNPVDYENLKAELLKLDAYDGEQVSEYGFAKAPTMEFNDVKLIRDPVVAKGKPIPLTKEQVRRSWDPPPLLMGFDENMPRIKL